MAETTHLLIIDDDQNFSDSARDYFNGSTCKVFQAFTLAEGVTSLLANEIDVVLLDQRLPDGEGPEIISQILDMSDSPRIILCTAYPQYQVAVQSLKRGVFDYLSKPIDLDELEMVLERAVQTRQLERIAQLQHYQRGKEQVASGIIGLESGLSSCKDMIRAAAGSDATALITGESGTGKSVVAKHIHYSSVRREMPFIAINCSALSPSLIEGELFGHEKGSFTGSTGQAKGVFELAHRGTLFLDEIGTMPLDMQTKLLNVLEEKKVRRIGGQRFHSVDVRIIAATNADVERTVHDGAFRSDLYYRLNVIRIELPPLRERLQDLPELVGHLLMGFARGDRIMMPSEEEIEKLSQYSWPGNIRELRNVLERAVLVGTGGLMRPSLFLPSEGRFFSETAPRDHASSPSEGIEPLESVVRRHIMHSYERAGRNLTRTARLLGIGESTLRRKLRKYSG